jgi:hypothetical protein
VTVKFFEPEPLRAGHRSTSIFAALSPEVTDLRWRCWAMVTLTGKMSTITGAKDTLSSKLHFQNRRDSRLGSQSRR